MYRSRTFLCLLAASVSLVVVLQPPAAQAAVVAEFRPAAASPGTRVQMAVTGLRVGDAVAFYLMPKRAEDVSAAELPRRQLVARRRIRPKEERGAKVDFTVPQSSPGPHVIVIHCRNCLPGGSTFSAGGDFSVIPPPLLPTTGGGGHGLLWLGTALLLLGALGLVRSRRCVSE